MKFKPANKIQDLQYFGEFGGVNPSISDSSTYTFLSAKTMFDTFEGNADGCYLYSRHSSPSNLYLGKALDDLTRIPDKSLETMFHNAQDYTLLHPIVTLITSIILRPLAFEMLFSKNRITASL